MRVRVFRNPLTPLSGDNNNAITRGNRIDLGTYDPISVGQAALQQGNVDRSSGSCTVPDPALTPGETDESLACVLLLYRKVCVDKTMKLPQAKKLYLKGWTQLVLKQ